MIVVGNDCNQYLLYKTEKEKAKLFNKKLESYMSDLLALYQDDKISLEEALDLSKNIYKGVEKYGLKFKEY